MERTLPPASVHAVSTLPTQALVTTAKVATTHSQSNQALARTMQAATVPMEPDLTALVMS